MFAQRVLGTWPRRLGALVGTALIGWMVSAAAPAIWGQATRGIRSDEPPLDIQVITDPERLVNSRGDRIVAPAVFVPKSIDDIGRPPGASRLRRWARDQDGADATETVFRLVIRGRAASPAI